MSTSTDGGSAADRDREARTAEGTPPQATGDLEFDEAWGGGAGESEPAREVGSRDPNPAFEDPNDR
jgi:hypothetical protein